jgi:ABC-type nitrate/sulfonate/bicarbonate transport system substrate-binding protein
MLRKMLIGLAFTAAAGTAAAQASKTLEVNVFAGGGNWPIWVAEEKGLFKKHGISIKSTNTPNSVSQIAGTLDGKFDIAMTTFDNIVAYQESQGETPLSTTPDFFAFMGSISGTLRFITQPDIRSYADVKGKTLGVDAASTGFALLMYQLLANNGLTQADYRIERLGGTTARIQGLEQRKIAGAMISAPSELPLLAKGFRTLSDATRDIGPYQGLVGMARRSWAEQNQDRLVPYIRAYVEAVDWLHLNVNREEAIEIFLKKSPNVSRDVAAQSYDALLNRREGFQKKARLDIAGMNTVMKVRSEFGQPKKTLTDPTRYFDERYYRQALR